MTRETITLTHLTDVDIYRISLPRGSYQISSGEDVEIVSNEGFNYKIVNCKTLPEIKQMLKCKTITHYVSSDDEKSVAEFNKELDKWDTRDDDNKFATLEDEFKYKLLRRDWTPIHKICETLSDPLTLEVKDTVLYSGNPYITSGTTIGQEPLLFTYNRYGAWVNITTETFSKLGMVRSESDLNYAETRNKKIWGGTSPKNGLRFVVAFGGYVFTNHPKFSLKGCPINGTLKEMEARYAEDAAEIEHIIQSAFAEHFVEIGDATQTYKEVHAGVKSALAELSKVYVKVGSSKHLLAGRAKLSKTIKLIEDFWKESGSI